VVLGLLTWAGFALTPTGAELPAQLMGLIASLVGMLAGSTLPQWMDNVTTPHTVMAP
jgi:solute:Na+ symporter, SSS family